jgi:hypothetical protein
MFLGNLQFTILAKVKEKFYFKSEHNFLFSCLDGVDFVDGIHDNISSVILKPLTIILTISSKKCFFIFREFHVLRKFCSKEMCSSYGFLLPGH